MLARIWRTRFDETRLDDIVRFANEMSLPLLAGRPGCEGVEFMSRGDEFLTITYWTDKAAIDATEADAEYRALVGKIEVQGFLVGDSETTVFELHGGTRDR